MKKTIITTLTMAGLAQVAFGFSGGIITIDTTEEAPNVYIEGVLDTSTDINLELLYFDTGSASYKPVVTLLLSQATGDDGVACVPWAPLNRAKGTSAMRTPVKSLI